MGSRLFAHIRGNIVGYVAVFLALSGGVYAASAGRETVKRPVVKDGTGTIVGSPLSATEEDLQIVSPTGYVVRLDWDGGLSTNTFAVTASYSGLDCTGDRYFPTAQGSDAVTYGKFTRPFDEDRLIAPIVSPGQGPADVQVQSYESVSLGCRNFGPTTGPAWPAKIISRARAGLPGEITAPLKITSR